MTPAEYAYLDLFIGNFAARNDAYVLDSRVHVTGDLTPEVLSDHWRDGHSVSTYTSLGDLTQVGAIDLDAGTLDEAKRVQDVLVAASIPALLCPSRRGAHLWTFHTALDYGMVEAYIVRAALQMAVGVSGWPHPASKAEVFPRRGDSDWSCGALRLPLMRHPKDGVTREVYSPFGKPITRISDLIEEVSRMTSDYASMRAFSAVDTAKVPYPTDLGGFRHVKVHSDDAPTVSALLVYMGVERAEPGHTCRCPFHDDSHNSLSIAVDDERAFCKAPHCDLYNDGRGLGSFQLANYIRERDHAVA